MQLLKNTTNKHIPRAQVLKTILTSTYSEHNYPNTLLTSTYPEHNYSNTLLQALTQNTITQRHYYKHIPRAHTLKDTSTSTYPEYNYSKYY